MATSMFRSTKTLITTLLARPPYTPRACSSWAAAASEDVPVPLSWVVDFACQDGRDLRHWLVVMEYKPEGDRDQMIDSYIKTLAKVVGSEEKARRKIYSVTTKYHCTFGAVVSGNAPNKLYELPGVHLVVPDSYVNVEKKDYGGEPFINGQAAPYDSIKYEKEYHLHVNKWTD